MSDQTQNHVPPILKSAWKRYADYDNTAKIQKSRYYNLRKWVLAASIAATLLAILLESFRAWFLPTVVTALQVLLILIPIVGSVLVAYLSKFQQGYKYLAMRSGAEEILKEIYRYRTIMQDDPRRDQWLQERLAQIQRQVHRTLGGEFVVIPYNGKQYNPNFVSSASGKHARGQGDEKGEMDDGIMPLDSEAYLRVRLKDQLDWHIYRIRVYQRTRKNLTIIILLFGGLGALFAGLDMIWAGVAVWVTLTTALASAATNWQELRGIDSIIPNYSKVILELNILYDRWQSLPPEKQTRTAFYELVRDTENVLWSQHVLFISAMKEAMDKAEADQEQIVNEAILASQEAVGKVQNEILDEARRSMETAVRLAEKESARKWVEYESERLPEDVLFNAALGPASAAIVSEDAEDVPEGLVEGDDG